MNQALVAWVVHELNTALAKAADGNVDAAKGAPHNWDEGWAFYAGAQPGCAAYVTADKRAKDFGTLSGDGETALANVNILAAFNDGRDALLAGDTSGAQAAADEIVRNLVVTYAQASIKYAAKTASALADGDAAAARIYQAEGYSFWRVLAPMVGPHGADTDSVEAVYALAAEPSDGIRAAVESAIAPALDALGISTDHIGEY